MLLLTQGTVLLALLPIVLGRSISDNGDEKAIIGNPIVKIAQGDVKGEKMSNDGRRIDRFIAIPYAEPPVGELRFNPPVPHKGWGSDVYDASQGLTYKLREKACLQMKMTQKDVRGSEDCLFLNVWVPGGVEEAKKNPLPVMVWIHGGAYGFGSGWGANFFDNWLYDQEALALHGNVIAVTLNYRLGPLGFLSTGDSAAPGNYGLLDQVEALRWVQNNIWAFGGDTDKVTIFGESAGAASVSFHMISPLSKNLFHRGISQSGTAFSSWAIVDEPVRWANMIGEHVGCPTTDTSEMMTCIRAAPIDDIVLAVKILERERPVKMDLPWSAVVDGNFLPGRPDDLMQNSADKDYLLGNNDMDGHMFVGLDFPAVNMDGKEMYLSDLERASTIFARQVPKQVSDSVVFQYRAYSDLVDDTYYKKQVLNLYTDTLFAAGTHMTAQYHSSMPETTGSTYVYLFSHPSKMPLIYPPWMGADHADDLQYVFAKPFQTPLVYTKEEREITESFMTYWTNFAWSGDPNVGPNGNFVPANWKPYDLQTRHYMEINASIVANGDASLGSNYRGEFLTFWGLLVPQMWTNALDTCAKSEEGIAPLNIATLASCPRNKQFQRETIYGCVQGESQSWGGKMYARFLGIPYASPPTGSHRFNYPNTPDSWYEPRDATQFSKSCPQVPFDSNTMDEDCLYLNVYAPVDTTISMDDVTTHKYPVMVWVHGGNYDSGDGGMSYEAGVVAAKENVIIVTFNYRLGSLGFFTSGDYYSPGNMAMFDQQSAFRWVRDNIATFSGDPERITLFGQGSGSESVMMHTLSSSDATLGVNRAILQSGVVMNLSKYGDQRDTSKRLGAALGCDTTDSALLVACLRSTTTGSLIAAQESEQLQFAPFVDGTFLTDEPEKLMQPATLAKWTYLMGVNTADGTSNWDAVASVKDQKDLSQLLNDQVSSKGGTKASNFDYLYTSPLLDQKNVQEQVLQLSTDVHYVVPTSLFADMAAEAGSSVYFYQFARVASFNPDQTKYPEWVGSSHGAELPFVWGDIVRIWTTESQYPDDAILTYNTIEYWTNFAKTGNPSSDGTGHDPNVLWPVYQLETKRYLNLDVNLEASSYLRGKQVYFWNELIPSLQEDSCPAVQM